MDRQPLLGLRPAVTTVSSLQALWTTNKSFLLFLIAVLPFALSSSAFGWSDAAVFALNFAAIIPLAKLLDFSTDQLAMRTGETVGGLLNATFGNAVELILGVMALRENLFHVIKASFIGSILSNLLLVLGCCFFFGGIIPFERNKFQEFDADKANVSTGLLSLTFLGFLVPCAMRFAFPNGNSDADLKILDISRGIAMVLVLTYFAYLIFQLYTNPDGLQVTPSANGADAESVEAPLEVETEQPTTVLWVALAALAGSTLVIAVCAELLVGSIEGLSKQAGISETFIGIIILPIVGNAAEHVTAVSSAMRNKMDLCIQVAVGSSHQIALLVAPSTVLVGWVVGKGLDLDFGVVQIAVLLVTTLVVNALIQDGRTHWFEGFMLIGAYVIVAMPLDPDATWLSRPVADVVSSPDFYLPFSASVVASFAWYLAARKMLLPYIYGSISTASEQQLQKAKAWVTTLFSSVILVLGGLPMAMEFLLLDKDQTTADMTLRDSRFAVVLPFRHTYVFAIGMLGD
ncbi:hypothetical protein HDU83_008640 [Entophlyctis luteolus]|nr:hypothetical protein HDU83_008640 [Entophlyctis luteolus]